MDEQTNNTQPIEQPTEQPVNNTQPQPTEQSQQAEGQSSDWFDNAGQQVPNDNSAQQNNPTEQPKEVDPLDTVPQNDNYKFFDENGKELPDDVTSDFKDFFKESGLTSRQANTLAQKYISKLTSMDETLRKEYTQKFSAMSKEWHDSIANDAEFGGQNMDQSVMYACRALNTYGSKELREFTKSGFGYHPELFKFIVRVGKAISDDKFVGGRAVRRETEYDKAKRMYPNSPELWGSPT